MIYGLEAHAKNYSLLLSSDQVALAPLYDISSVAPYPARYDLYTMTMAMSINGKYQNSLITGQDWRAFANQIGANPDQILRWTYDIADRAPDAIADAVHDEDGWIAELDMSTALINEVAANSTRLLRFLERPHNTAEPDISRSKRPGKPTVAPYRKANGTWVSGYPNPHNHN